MIFYYFFQVIPAPPIKPPVPPILNGETNGENKDNYDN